MKNLKLMLFGLIVMSFLNNNVILAQDAGNNMEDTEEFNFVYPIKVKQKDGSIVTVNNDEEHDQLYDKLFEESLEYVFPIKVKENGILKTIKNEEELFAFDSTVDTELPEIEMVYPIKAKQKDGSTITINNDKEHDEIYEKSFEEPFEYIFPIKVKENGILKTIKNEEELFAFDSAVDTELPEIEIVYPITIKQKDGSTITVNNDEEHDKLYDKLFEEPLEYVFPIKVKENGVLKTIKDEKELFGH